MLLCIQVRAGKTCSVSGSPSFRDKLHLKNIIARATTAVCVITAGMISHRSLNIQHRKQRFDQLGRSKRRQRSIIRRLSHLDNFSENLLRKCWVELAKTNIDRSSAKRNESGKRREVSRLLKKMEIYAKPENGRALPIQERDREKR